MAGNPDPKPEKRVKDKDLMHNLHLLRAGTCALCDKTFGLHLHHVKLRSQGGDDARENLRWLCSEHHDRLHSGNLTEEELARIRAAPAP